MSESPWRAPLRRCQSLKALKNKRCWKFPHEACALWCYLHAQGWALALEALLQCQCLVLWELMRALTACKSQQPSLKAARQTLQQKPRAYYRDWQVHIRLQAVQMKLKHLKSIPSSSAARCEEVSQLKAAEAAALTCAWPAWRFSRRLLSSHVATPSPAGHVLQTHF